MPQNATKTGLTKKEQLLLEALLDPMNRYKSITEICGMVGCDRSTYYRAFDKPEFINLYTRLSADLAKKHLGQVMNAFVNQAVRGSFQHGKVLLEMAGVYTETSKQDVNLQGQVTETHELSKEILKDPETRHLARELFRRAVKRNMGK